MSGGCWLGILARGFCPRWILSRGILSGDIVLGNIGVGLVLEGDIVRGIMSCVISHVLANPKCSILSAPYAVHDSNLILQFIMQPLMSSTIPSPTRLLVRWLYTI